MSALKDLTGQKFGRLTVIRQAEKYISPSGCSKSRWVCLCDCGNPNEIIVLGNDLNMNKTKSCGCLHDEVCAKRFKKINKKNNNYDLTGEYGIGYDSNGKEFYFDLEDYDKIKNYCWLIANDGYAKTTVHYKDENNEDKKHTILMHRVIMNPENNKIYIDHKHGKETRNDNRKCNLRFATPSQNNMNKGLQSNNTSGVTGVYWNKKKSKWTASIKSQKNGYYLGDYDNFEDAVNARRKAEEKYHGEYASSRAEKSR